MTITPGGDRSYIFSVSAALVRSSVAHGFFLVLFMTAITGFIAYELV